MNSKIQKDINELVEQQVISNETASNIEAYYLSKKDHSPNRLFVVFGVLGSLLVGLGIILILANNWDNFSTAIKTVFAFTPLVIGQLIVGYSILKKKSATWKEGSGTFLFFAVGSCLALISQIYNIPGNLSEYLLTWIVLCLPLIYLLKSNALAVLHIVFSTYYACEFGYFSGGNKEPWIFFILLAFVVPFYYRLLKHRPQANITSIFNWLFPLSVVITLGTFVGYGDQFGFLMYVLFFGLLYNIGKIPFFDDQKLRRNGYLILGSMGTIVTLLIASFRWFWKFSFKSSVFELQEFYFSVFLFLITVGLLVYMNGKKWIKDFNLFQYVFILFSTLFIIGFINDIISTVLVNILVLALGLTTIKIGVDQFHFGILNYGLLIITTLVICRFFDTNMSFVVRGLLFVAVGIGFFVTNYIMLKRQKKINHLKSKK